MKGVYPRKATRRWRGLARVLVVVGGGVAALATIQAGAPSQGTAPAARTPTTVLFLCPHGAAKSVLASAYFRRLAQERGLNVRVDSAGTEPDPEIAPAVAAHLKNSGYDVPAARPRRASDTDMAATDIVVSIGCDLTQLPAPRGTLLDWDDVPAPSEDFARAEAKIRERVMQLVDELVRKAGR